MSRDRLRTSTSPDGRLIAQWHLDGTMARIHQVHNEDDAERGLTAFDAANLPDLVKARETHPEYEAVWDAVRHDRLAAVFAVADLPAASA
ncbi:hypothetical protein [Nocardia pseudovaccinii]|uniref:hypothetical protein n=1 Tax=Nocardia pseudovaccinii TaxID=189540 RepID=UPI0007A3CE1F|nr:hypothetical protein [Nocardia pseudovaccinii]